MKKIIILKEELWLDDETVIEEGLYEFKEEGINGWPMIKVDNDWYDVILDDSINYHVIVVEE